MLKSKSLTNLIYEINNKPIYYNIKLQKPYEKNVFSSIPATNTCNQHCYQHLQQHQNSF